MARWSEEGSKVDDFFILEQLGDMLPLPKLSKDDLPSYLEAVQKVADYQLQNIQRLKSQ
jgi:hypothetical protein